MALLGCFVGFRVFENASYCPSDILKKAIYFPPGTLALENSPHLLGAGGSGPAGQRVFCFRWLALGEDWNRCLNLVKCFQYLLLR